ncbi:formyltransferase family protein [Ensifer adhaerens]|uniref:formyltransferase family protein n=1 Tax=Ensifer adhaerens TaxID=106592 RepID=UPI0015C32F80|nr:formyltransferase family protein [Ensifer adhaerens]
MKLAILVSSGGAAFEQVARIVRHDGIDFTVITDRPCGAEAVASRVDANHIRIEERDRRLFSAKVAASLGDLRIDNLLLFFDRLVSKELFDHVDTFNIHPAALPAFKGLRGVEDAYQAKVRLLGCSLHRVDQSMDGGELVSQIACGVDPQWSLSRWQKRAYLMKVYCGLVWVSQALRIEIPRTPVNASHGLPEKWMASFRELQALEGETVV